MSISWAGLARRHRPRRGPLPRRRLGAPARDRGARRRRRGRRRGRGRRHRRLAPGPEHPRPGRRAARRCPRRTSRTCAPASSIGVDLVALSFVRRPEDVLLRARAHARAAHRQDREAPGRRPRRGDHQASPTASWSRAATSASSCRSRRCRSSRSACSPWPGAHGAPVDHRDADARLDGHLLAPDARRGRRRRQRDPRRHRRGDALPGDRGRRPPGRRHRDDGRGRAHDRARGALRALERDARAPRRARPGLHGRPLRLRGRARAAASTRSSSRRCRAARRGWSPRTAPTSRSTRSRPGSETVRRCGLMWGVRAASMRRHEVTEELIADAAAPRRRARLVQARASASASPPGCRAAGRGRRACSRSSSSRPRTAAPGAPRPRAAVAGARRAGRAPGRQRHHDERRTIATIASGEPRSPSEPPSAV